MILATRFALALARVIFSIPWFFVGVRVADYLRLAPSRPAWIFTKHEQVLIIFFCQDKLHILKV